eukprot:6468257-Karenia_brevis.AAC.1
MQQTRNEYPADAYESAYDTLAHDLLRDEKLRARGVKTQGWAFEETDGNKVHAGRVDRVGQNFQLIHNFRAK